MFLFAFLFTLVTLGSSSLFSDSLDVVTLVTNKELLDDPSDAIDKITNNKPVLFENVNTEILKTVLIKSSFPVYPNERRHYLFIHKYKDLNGNNYYLTKEYLHFKIKKYIISSNGYRNNSTISSNNKYGILSKQYKKDILDYIKYCSNNFTLCKKYKNDWYLSNGFKDDESGMIPLNSTTCWGQLETQTYIDNNDTTFSSLIPNTLYIYAQANQATLDLENMLLYMLSPGIHSQVPQCNSDGCKGYVHRELWVNISVTPLAEYNVTDFYWIFSEPQTVNQQSSTTTSVADTTTMGLQGTFGPNNNGIHFEDTNSFTNGYSYTIDTQDFSIIENTVPSTGEGKWIFYQESPVNILDYPLYNFPNDYEMWYSSVNNPCQIISGPELAYSTQQTSNAIKWNAAPQLINYYNETLDVTYTVNVLANVDILWCPDWSGNPPNACNEEDGGSHHCTQWYMVEAYPTWNSNIIQSMNNLN